MLVTSLPRLSFLVANGRLPTFISSQISFEYRIKARLEVDSEERAERVHDIKSCEKRTENT